MLVCAGCSVIISVTSIVLLNTEDAIVVEVGKFNYDDYKFNVTYSNGTSKQITLAQDMIDDYDKLKLYQVGEQTITVKYENFSYDMKITVKRASLDDVEFNDKVVTYTGESVTMEVEGYLPADAIVRYPNGNCFTNAGVYNITAICYGDKYETKQLSATLTINKATYDMTGVTFKDAEYVYDKSSKSISIDGTLPAGVSVSYKIGEAKGNSKIDSGEYTVVASFSSSNANYEKIADMSAVLKINKAQLGDFDLKFDDKSVVYSGQSYSISADLTSLPSGVSWSYTIQKIKDAQGNLVTAEAESGNSATLAGTYIVTINFAVKDTANYESIAPKSATLFIDRATHTLDNAYMYSQSFEYDGNAHAITLSGSAMNSQPELPFGVSVSYTIRQIKDSDGNQVDGETSQGNSATDAGTYEVCAYFTDSNENYNQIDYITAILVILEAE